MMEVYRLTHLLLTSLVLGAITLATIVGNVFVIIAISLDRNLRNVANYLIASLAVTDLLVAALVMPLALYNEVNTRWSLGRQMCDMWVSFDVLCCTSSIFHLVCISLDRYWAVTRIDYIHNRSPRRILCMIGFSWAISTAISIPPQIGWWDAASNQTDQCLISQDPGYTVFSTVGAFYIPLAFIVVVYSNVYRAARKRIRMRQFRRNRCRDAQRNNLMTETPSTTGTTGGGLRSSVSVGDSKSRSLLQVPGEIYGTELVPQRSLSVGDAPAAANPVPKKEPIRRHLSATPPVTSSPASYMSNSRGESWIDLTRSYFQKRRTTTAISVRSIYRRFKKKRAQGRERKAARTLAVITGTFVVCWLPFFIMATVRPFCGERCYYPAFLISIISWLGYCNSLLNPIIYTLFNPDFRTVFKKILFVKYRRQKFSAAVPVASSGCTASRH